MLPLLFPNKIRQQPLRCGYSNSEKGDVFDRSLVASSNFKSSRLDLTSITLFFTALYQHSYTNFGTKASISNGTLASSYLPSYDGRLDREK